MKKQLATMMTASILGTTLFSGAASANNGDNDNMAAYSNTVKIGNTAINTVVEPNGNVVSQIDYNNIGYKKSADGNDFFYYEYGGVGQIQIKKDENGNWKVEPTTGYSTYYNSTRDDFYSETTRSIAKPVVDAWLGQVEFGFRLHFNGQFTLMERVLIAKGVSGPALESIRNQYVELMTYIAMEKWIQESLIGNMNEGANNINEMIKNGDVPAIDTTVSPYWTAMTAAGNGFGQINQLFLRAEKMNEEARLELEAARVVIAQKEMERKEEYERILAERAKITPDYTRAKNTLELAKKYGGDIHIESALEKIALVENTEFRSQLQEEWDTLFKAGTELRKAKKDTNYKKAISMLSMAKSLKGNYILKAKDSINLVSHPTLKAELQEEWDTNFKALEKEILEQEALELAKKEPTYTKAKSMLSMAKLLKGNYILKAQDSINLVNHPTLKAELQMEWDTNFKK